VAVALERGRAARERLRRWPEFAETPLVALPSVAAACGVAQVAALLLYYSLSRARALSLSLSISPTRSRRVFRLRRKRLGGASSPDPRAAAKGGQHLEICIYIYIIQSAWCGVRSTNI